ncbi:hypothetical protein DID75_01450 [Candidatus Marinamargulisbacteria bacterium SCGC AG-410-N11]|nr:hypothetical protein DID75_01450 [Candidatus Marinamargulisbacteria bacterium SCGC AG-410-N11]
MSYNVVSAFSYSLAILVTCCWGVNFIFAKVVLSYWSPFVLLIMRFSLVSILLLPVLIKGPPVAIKQLFPISVTFSVLHLTCMFGSLYLGLSASIGVLVQQLGIPFLLILSVFFLKEKGSLVIWIGVFCSLLGTFFLMNSPNSIQFPIAFILMVLSAFFFAVYSIQIKHISKKCKPLELIGWISILSLPMVLIIGIVFDRNLLITSFGVPLKVWISLGYIAVASSITAHSIWFYLISNNPIQKIAPIILLVPLVGVAAGILILNDALSLKIVIGGILMVVGVAMIVINKSSNQSKIKASGINEKIIGK